MDNNIILNRVFIQNTLKQLESEKKSEAVLTVIKRYLNDSESLNYNQAFSEIYKYLKNNYRNEYFYKNTLLNKLLLGVHKPTTTTALSEVPIAKSKADFVLINGKAVVYEIKTELDTFERLKNQINDYYKAFDHVTVLTSIKNQYAITEILKDTPVGICLLTDRDQIRVLKKPIKNTEKLDKNEIFKVLNKSEFENIIQLSGYALPRVQPVKYYTECKKIINNIEIDRLYSLYLKELKKRNRIIIEQYSKVPYELKSLVYFCKFKEKEYKELFNLLNCKVEG